MTKLKVLYTERIGKLTIEGIGFVSILHYESTELEDLLVEIENKLRTNIFSDVEIHSYEVI